MSSVQECRNYLSFFARFAPEKTRHKLAMPDIYMYIVYIDRYTVLDKNKPKKLRLILVGFIIRLELSLSF